LSPVDIDAPKPLKMRVDPANTGLPRGLALVATEEKYRWSQPTTATALA